MSASFILIGRLQVTDDTVDKGIYKLAERKLALDAAVLEDINVTSKPDKKDRKEKQAQVGQLLMQLFQGVAAPALPPPGGPPPDFLEGPGAPEKTSMSESGRPSSSDDASSDESRDDSASSGASSSSEDEGERGPMERGRPPSATSQGHGPARAPAPLGPRRLATGRAKGVPRPWLRIALLMTTRQRRTASGVSHRRRVAHGAQGRNGHGVVGGQ